MMLFRLIFLAVSVLTLSCKLYSQNMKDAIIKLVGDPALKNGNVSFTILDQKSGDLIATHNPNMSLIPASSLKLLTCAYGLKQLGKDFRFKTVLEITGKVDAKGILQGDLILHGYGDPTLGSEMTVGSMSLDRVLDEFADAVTAAGIHAINGKVYGDGSFFSKEGICDSWQWNDIGNYYGAGVYGLNIYDNLYKLKFKQSRQNFAPSINSFYPAIPDLNFISQVISAGPNSGDNAYIYGGPLQNNCRVKGTIPSGTGFFEIKGSLPDPTAAAAWLLAQKLKSRNIQVQSSSGSLKDPLPEGKRTILKTHFSQPLDQIVNQTLLKSINLNAEAILRYCGAVSQANPTLDNAMKNYVSFLEQESDAQSGFYLADGSGLSKFNSIPSLGFAKVLYKFFKDETLSGALLNSLPVAGISGTLKNFLTNSPAKGKIKAKTGSMERVRSYSGIITGSSQKNYVFTLIINNYSCSSSQIKSKVENFLESMYKLL